MLSGEQVALRPRIEDDVPVLHAELYDDVAFFSVVEQASGELAGEALVYAIDGHNRTGHVGLALRPAFRGRGLAKDTLTLLCRYGFEVRGLNRLQLETLSDNEAMIKTALGVGFVEEGRLRSSRWIGGGFADELVFGQLADERER